MNKYSHTIVILAFNNHDLTLKNISHLISLGYRKNILLFDNGSIPSFKTDAKNLKIRYHRESKNIYVNPAWNMIFKKENCDYLTLLNNDCFILSINYFSDIIKHMKENNIGISSCKTKNISKLDKGIKTNNYFYFSNEISCLQFYPKARRQGWLMTLDFKIYKSLEYLIPDYLKVWYGDDWIWGQFVKNKINTAVYSNRYAIHIKSSSTSLVKVRKIIQLDKINLVQHGIWYKEVSPIIHKRTRIFSRYV